MSQKLIFPGKWIVDGLVDDDGHLNLYIQSEDGSDIQEVETGQGDGKNGELYALRFTTKKIEQDYHEESSGDWVERYPGTWREHRRFTLSDWRREVNDHYTRLGYEDWVANQIVEKKQAGVPVWIGAWFTIDDQTIVKGFHLPHNLWKGWEQPLFEKEDLIEWLKKEIPASDRIAYIPEQDAILCPEDGNESDHQFAVGITVITEFGPKHLYGPEGWTWELADAPDSPCEECGHTRDAHLYNGQGRCGLCECHKFKGARSA